MHTFICVGSIEEDSSETLQKGLVPLNQNYAVRLPHTYTTVPTDALRGINS